MKNYIQPNTTDLIYGTEASTQNQAHSSLNTILSKFRPVKLSDMGHATLQNRKESKYLLTTNQALYLLERLPETYQIFEVDEKKSSDIFYDIL